MRIGIDARIFRYPDYTGIAHSLWKIIEQWSVLYPEHDYYLISATEICLPRTLPDNWQCIVQQYKVNGTLWSQTTLRSILKHLKLDVFWGTNFLLPARVIGTRYLLSVYDMAFLSNKKEAEWRTWLVLRLFCKRSCIRADRIIAISHATATDITQYYGIPEQKLSVCYLGTDLTPKENFAIALKPSCNEEDHDTAPKRFADSGLEEPGFLLFLSTIGPRKNPVTILKAYARYREQGGKDYKLVFAGARGWKLKAFDAALEQHPYREDILLTGYIDEEEKTWLLQHARMLLYPSLYEGFGIPILEAFACGTPVITSDISSMPEVGGDAAFYVKNPLDVQEMAALIARVDVLGETELRDIRQRMKTQLQKFSWERCAKETMRVLEEAARTAEAHHQI